MWLARIFRGDSLTREEFARLLSIGHGRAYLAALEDPSLIDSDLIYEKCGRDSTMISESARAEYLSKFIDLLPDRELILARLWKRYIKESPAYFYGDEFHLRQIALVYAKRGDKGACEALYKRVLRSLEVGKVFGVEELLEVGREQALDRVISILDSREKSAVDDNLCHVSFAIEEVFGEEWLDRWLQENASESRTIQHLLEVRKAPRDTRKRFPRISTVSQLMAEVDEDGDRLPYDAIRSFVEHATDEEFAIAARNLPSDPKILAKYLTMFRKRTWPLDLYSLFDLTRVKGNRGRRWRAVRAVYQILKEIHAPAVRKFALDRLEDRYHGQLAAQLLIKNYIPGDEERIRHRADRSLWPQEMHSILSDLLVLVEEHPEIADGYVVYLYETIPCGFCRYLVVKAMSERGLVTDEIRHECRNDSEEDTRNLFSKLLR